MPIKAFFARAATFLLTVSLLACTSQSPEALIASGKAFSAKNDHKAATIQFKAALQANPQSAEARLLLGKSLLSQRDPVGAATELTKALDDRAPAVDVLPALSEALVLAGDFKKLVTSYGDVVLEDKQAQAALKSNVATAWGALGDRAKTEAAAAAALASSPDYGPAKLLQARLLAGAKKFDEATAVVDSILAKDDQDAGAWLLRGELLSAARADHEAAEASFRKALDIDRSSIPAHSALITSQLMRRDVAAAKIQATQLRAAAPNHPYTTVVDAQLALLDHQPERAREHVQLLLRAFPDRAGILMLAGAIEAELGSVVQAAAYFGKVVQLNPSLESARRSLAEVEIRMGQYSKALETVKPLLSGDPPSAAALSLAGDAELRLGNADVAEAYFVRAAKLDPHNLRAQTAAAMSRLWGRDASAALADLQALSAKSQDTYADEALFAARMKRREYDAALATLDVMAKKQPGKAAHWEMRGRVHMARRDLVAARKAFEEALRADPALYGAVSRLAFLDLSEGRREQAVSRLRASAAADPKNWMALLALAELKARDGADVVEVKKLLSDAVLASPSSAEPHRRLIEFNLRKRQFKDALTAAQQALAAVPGDVGVLEAAGQAQFQAGDVEQAATTFRALASAVPGSAGPYLRLAEVYGAMGKRDQAETAIKKALEVDPGSEAAHMALLDILAGSNRLRNAMEHIQRIKREKPTQALGYKLEAAYNMRARNTDAALASLREGLSKSGNPEIAGKYYSLLHRSGRAAEAETFGAGWIKQHPKDAAFEYLLAESNIAGGNFRLAEARLRRVLAVYPAHLLALNNLAWVIVKNGGQGAVGYAQSALDLQPDSPALMDTLAFALAAEGKVGQALEIQKRAVEMSPTGNGLRLNLAKIALQAGDKALARRELEALQKLGTGFPQQTEVARLLQGL